MVLASVAKHIDLPAKDVFPYAPSEGLKALREKWKAMMVGKNPSIYGKEFSTPVVTCGVTHALSMVGYMFADDTDEVIMADLYWENYDLVFTSAYGAELKFFNFFKNQKFDVESFRKTVNSGHIGKKIVLLNFPNNPSGYTPTKDAAKEIITVLTDAAKAGNKLAVVLDDSYFGLDFEEDIFAESLFSQLAHAHENLLAIKMDGITKEEFAWGFRVGFVTYGIKGGTAELYKALEDKTAGAVRGNISNAPNLSQSLLLNAMQSETHGQEKARNKSKLKERYQKVKETLAAHPEYAKYFEALPFNSGYFMCVVLKKADVDKVWDTLLKKYSTGVICYSEKHLLRIAFSSTPTQKIEALFNNIYEACKDCTA
jgi:aspartate/methionine/tyrosine aminotransferase